ncbi:MAG: GtrA family protein [Lachnospiraceae bacterium]
MKKMLKQFCKFSVVGVMAFLIDYGLLYIFTESFGMHYLVSSMISFVIATIFNYVYSTKYVFDCKQEQNTKGQFTVFVLLSSCGLFLNSILMKNLVEHLAIYYMGAKLISGVIVSIWNFASRKIFLEEDIREKIAGKKRALLRD